MKQKILDIAVTIACCGFAVLLIIGTIYARYTYDKKVIRDALIEAKQ